VSVPAGPWDRIDQIVSRINHKIETCHKRVACPKCKAPVGQRCWKVNSKRYLSPEPGVGMIPAVECKSPHEERWTQEVPKR
jgi:hypothetical protein